MQGMMAVISKTVVEITLMNLGSLDSLGCIVVVPLASMLRLPVEVVVAVEVFDVVS